MPDALRNWSRRSASITLFASSLLLGTLALPLLLPLAALVDRLRRRRRWPTVRCLAFVLVYLACECAGIAASAGLWIRHRLRRAGSAAADDGGSWAHRLTGVAPAYLSANLRLQRWWAGTLFAAAERIFGMRTVIAGDEAVRRGPFLLLLRHASIGDTLLPAVFVAARHDIALRYVMKRELLWDPCLDIVGNRLPNHFVRRGSGDSEREIAVLQRLMRHLGPHDGVLIYPEGTRFSSPAKRERAVARLQGAVPPRLLAMARTLRYVLPPRLGGTLGLLAANPGVDAVVCAHTGFEGAESFRDLLAGSLIDQEIRVRFWRVPFADIPTDPGARAEWLYAQWQRVDAWIAEQRGDRSAPPRRLAAARG